MSGGSWDYLYANEIDSHVSNTEPLKQMSERLRQDGFVDAAHETLNLALDISAIAIGEAEIHLLSLSEIEFSRKEFEKDNWIVIDRPWWA